MCKVLTSELDKVAPLKTVTRTSTGKRINRFLSDEAVGTKQERRRLERCWKGSGKETDQQRYRLINNSRRHYYADQINNLSQDLRKRWAAAKELLCTPRIKTTLERKRRIAQRARLLTRPDLGRGPRGPGPEPPTNTGPPTKQGQGTRTPEL